MKIVTIIPTMTSGGAEKVCLRLHALMTARGVESHLVILSEQVQYDFNKDDRIHVLPLRTAKNLDLWLKKRKAVRLLQGVVDRISNSGPIDAIFSHLDEAHIITRQLSTTAARYYVIHTAVTNELNAAAERGWLKHRRLKNKKLAMRGEDVICVSEGLGEEVKTLAWLTPRSVHTIHNPLDAALVQTESAASVDVPVDNYIIHIGRFARAKRHDVLFDAFAQLVKTKPDVKLVLLTRLSSKLQRELEERKLSQQVVTPGMQQNPYPWIKKAKLLVLSSDFEGLPNVLVEALMCGTPIVSTDCPHGPAEILRGFHEDWLVPRNDPAALANAINRVLEQEPQVVLEDWPLLKELSPQRAVDKYLALAAHKKERVQ